MFCDDFRLVECLIVMRFPVAWLCSVVYIDLLFVVRCFGGYGCYFLFDCVCLCGS